MPRPGPRPYECVRRSWHSDRHQAIRGSIIQHIFRVAHENHSASTKKNREWQEKLPLVVLKSEEIMYSKANSEAEYVDPETLWDRVNDAIDTIIRKDDSMETGEFLPPCVEAALNLGCVPVRTLRSQRNNTTRNYLTPRNQDPGPTPPEIAENPRTISLISAEKRPPLPPPSAFPLYHGFHFPPRRPQTEFQNSNPIIIGTPVFQAAHEPLTMLTSSQSQKGCSEGEKFHKKSGKEGSELAECDLSLRLGLTKVNGVDYCSRKSQRKEFCFFPLNSEGEQVGNKRKTTGSKQIDEQTKRQCL